MSIAHRYPTIQFLRPRMVEPRAKATLYWNGKMAPNGDGVAGGEAEVDYGAALAEKLVLWRMGHLSMFGGGFGAGGFAEPHADADPASGRGSGRYGEGMYAVGNPTWSWKFPFALRDGNYKVAARVLDWLGNEQLAPDEVLEFEIAALPRPPRNALAVYDDDKETLTVRWQHSPEFEPES